MYPATPPSGRPWYGHGLARGLALLLLLGCSGCQGSGWYLQALAGQWQLVVDREPVEAVRGSAQTPAEIRTALGWVEEARAAAPRYGLAAGDRFRTFVATGRRALVWNVYATPRYALEPVEWCFPIAGCVVYRGWFDRADAEREQERLAAAGHDVWIGGAAAYSTLGWFADPVVDTMLQGDAASVYGTIIHELAHARLYVPGDAQFNESLATFIERVAVADWLRSRGDEALLGAVVAREAAWRRVVAFVADWRARLRAGYAAAADDDARGAARQRLLAAMRADYLARRADLGAGRWDGLFGERLNHATLVPIATYDDAVPAFGRLLAQCAGDWACFHARAARLAALAPAERARALAALRTAAG